MRRELYLLLILLSFGPVSNGQIILGTQVIQSGTMGVSPYNYSQRSRHVQFVYTAVEILSAGGVAGNITALAWDISQLAGGTLVNYQVRMAHTTALDASVHNPAALTTVKNAFNFAPPGGTGWYTITFDTPFNWDGVNNLLLDVCWGVNAANAANGQVWMYNNVANQIRGISNPATSQCPVSTSTAASGKPRVNFAMNTASCMPPTSVSVSGITSSTATISWIAPALGSPVNYEWKVVNLGDGSGGVAVDNGSVSHPTLTDNAAGLNSGTFYDVWVRTFCGGSDYSSWAGPLTFATTCTNVTSFPYIESFNGPIFAPSCWLNEKLTGPSNPATWDRQTEGFAPDVLPYHGAGMARYNAQLYGIGTSGMLVSKGLNLPSDLYRVRFYFYRDDYGYLTTPDLVNVYYNTTDTILGATLLGTINRSYSMSPVESTGGWKEYAFNFPVGSAGNGRYVIFEGVSAWGNNMYFDYVNIEAIPTCLSPTNLNATNILNTSADLGWTENNSATSWQVEWGLQGFTLGSGTRYITSQNPGTLPGLTPGTNYSYYVRSICIPGDTSYWSIVEDFSTGCAISTLPFSETFDDPAIPICWTMEGPDNWEFNTNWPEYGANSATDHTGNGGNFAGVDGSFPNPVDSVNLLTPLIDFGGALNVHLDFWLFNNNINDASSQTLQIDMWNGSSWISNVFFYGTSQNDPLWQHFIVELYPYSYSGPVQFRLMVEKLGTNPLYDDLIIDDFTLYDVPFVDLGVIQNNVETCAAIGLVNPLFTIQNFGTDTLQAGDNFDASYKVNAGSWVNQNFTVISDILPGAQENFSFSTAYNFNQYIVYNCILAVNYPDIFPVSDSSFFSISQYGYPADNLGPDTTVCHDISMLLDAGNPGSTYLWWNGDTSKTVTVDSLVCGGLGSCTFYVTVDNNGCITTDSVTITWTFCTGTDETDVIDFMIWPNPANEFINISVPGIRDRGLVEITDISGRLVKEMEILCGSNSVISLNVGDIERGIYFISIEISDQQLMRKLIIE